jgi:hypothetical protein
MTMAIRADSTDTTIPPYRVPLAFTGSLVWGDDRIKSWHKNHALLMASHLPTDVEDARIVLELLRDIFERFVAEPEPEHGTECANVVTLVKGDGRCPS